MAKNRLLPYHSAMPGAMRFLLCFLLLTSLAFSSQKHVTVNGAGTHNGGSVDNAWTMTEANDNATAGDTVNVHAGTYLTQLAPIHDGTVAGGLLVFRNYGSDVVKIATTNTNAIDLSSKDSIVIDGFWLDHSYRPFYANAATNLIIRNCRVDSFAATGSYYGMCKIENCSYIYVFNCNFHRHEEYDNWNVGGYGTGNEYKDGDGFQIANSQYVYFDSDTSKGAPHYNILASGNNCRMIYFTNCLFSTGHGLAGMNNSGNAVYYDNCKFRHQFTQTNSGTHIQLNADTSVVRYCQFIQDTISLERPLGDVAPMVSYFGEVVGDSCTYSRFYNNTVVNYAGPYGNHQAHSLGLTDSATWHVRHHIFKNNVFLHPNRNRETIWFKSTNFHDADFDDTLSNNILWRGASGADSIFRGESRDGAKWCTLAEAKSNFPRIWLANNREADPKLTGATDPRPTGASPLINSAIALSSPTSAGSNSTSLQVSDPCYFFPGWTGGIITVQGDSIKVGSSIRRITAISGNTLTLNDTASWASGAPVYIYQWRHWVGSAPDVGALERPAFAVDTCLMGTTVSSGQVGTMTVAREDANYFLVAIGIDSSSVQVDSCYVTGSSPVVGTRVLRQTQGSSPGNAVELWEIRNPGVGPQNVRVKLAGNTDFAWGLVTVNGVDERVSPVSAGAQLSNNFIQSISQYIAGNGTVLWATLQNTVTPGTGVTVIGTKSDLRQGTRTFTLMKKPNGGSTTFSYTQSPKGPLAAGGAAIGAVVAPPDPGE